MNTNMILGQARAWALDYLRLLTCPLKVHMNVGNIDDTIRHFLLEVPQTFGCNFLQQWSSSLIDDHIIYSRDGEGEPCSLFIRVFEDKTQAYAAVYEQGRIVGSTCLVIWNKECGRLVNPGYAQGRCPVSV